MSTVVAITIGEDGELPLEAFEKMSQKLAASYREWRRISGLLLD